jgi:hypothetical protein
MCYKLTGNKIPKWVNRLARIGDAFTFANSYTILALILTIDLHLELFRIVKLIAGFRAT